MNQPVNVLRLNIFENYSPHQKQWEFHESLARFKNLIAGRRSGKTFGAGREFIKRILDDYGNTPKEEIDVYLAKRKKEQERYRKKKNRNRKKKNVKPLLHYWAVAPDYNLSKIQQREVFEVLEEYEDELGFIWSESDKTLWLMGCILIEFKSADNPKKLVGTGLNGLWIDETARLKPEVWSGNMRMTLSDKRGWGIFSTTPLGKNWYYEEIYRFGDSVDELHNDEYENFHFTTLDNTTVPALREEVEQARKTLPKRYFEREYMASLESFHGQIYDEFSRKTHVVKDSQIPYDQFIAVIGGKDWNFAKPGATVLIGITKNGDYYAFHEEYKAGRLINSNDPGADTWVKVDKSLYKKHKVGVYYADPSEPQNLADYRQNKIPIRKANNDVHAGIQTVATLLHINEDTGKPRLFISENLVNLIKEIEGYKWKENREGIFREEPDKDRCPDHLLDALRYALHSHIKTKKAKATTHRSGMR